MNALFASFSTPFAQTTGDQLLELADTFVESLPAGSEVLAALIAIGVLLVVCGILWWFTHYVGLKLVAKIISRTRSRWDDAVEASGVFKRLAPLPSLVVLYAGVALMPLVNETWDEIIRRITLALLVLTIVRAISAGFTALDNIYRLYERGRERPIKGIIQVFQVATYFIGIILILSVLMHRSPVVFFTGLGAMTAVLMLVFRDTLLSLVAGVQLTATGQIRVGDWIEMPNFGADGTVTDIALNTVSVQNFDRTMTIIPAHKFLENSFRNWRNVFDTDARRIKRHLLIDTESIHFLDEEAFERMSKFRLLAPYMEERKEQILAFNEQALAEGANPDLVNLRAMTNFGTFRAYATAYLRAHTRLRPDLSMMVRHLQPTPEGIPLEIYCFSRETSWPVYEGIQADIFEHLISVMPHFGLRPFQAPSGHSISSVNAPQDDDAPPENEAALIAPANGH